MSKYIIVGGELYHYGVPGMKWGVRKQDPRRLQSRIDKNNAAIAKMERKIAKYDTKADKRLVKSGRYARLAEWTGKSNRFSRRAARREARVARLTRDVKSMDQSSEQYLRTKKRIAKNSFKAAKARRRALIKGLESNRGRVFNRLSARHERKGKKFLYKNEIRNLKIHQLNQQNIQLAKRLVEAPLSGTKNDKD